MTSSQRPISASQIRIVLSKEPEATFFESCENTTEMTWSLWPSSTRLHATFFVSQIRIVLSLKADTTMVDCGETTTQQLSNHQLSKYVTKHWQDDMASNLDIVTQGLSTVKLEDKPAIIFVNNATAIAQLVDFLDEAPAASPSIFIDLEGVDLSRHETISIIQVYYLPTKCTYLSDVYTLRDECFSTPGKNCRTLKEIFECDSIPKVFFDVRNDSDALYGNYQIKLAGIYDLQLMELATRSISRRCITGLSKCIERDAPMSIQERLDWVRTKEGGLRLFAPEKGGRYEVFNERPLPDAIKFYCAQDVQILPRLWAYYDNKMGQRWRERMIAESRARVKLSQSSTFNGKGRHMALAPTGW
ncbi:3'-5' exonuclease [Fusarium bulbicola]|nr:3'-5' exonuclease [Fusarium bulbicola]